MDYAVYLRHPDYMVCSLASRSLKNLEPAVLVESLAATDGLLETGRLGLRRVVGGEQVRPRRELPDQQALRRRT